MCGEKELSGEDNEDVKEGKEDRQIGGFYYVFDNMSGGLGVCFLGE
ncbi:hypothetical protein [Staphylococcus pettenkoferi]|nr:hypothetical protein [Staphylococcus pettenkoferi]